MTKSFEKRARPSGPCMRREDGVMAWLCRVWPVPALSVAGFVLLVIALTWGLALNSPLIAGARDLRNVHAMFMSGGVTLLLISSLVPWRTVHGALNSVAVGLLVAGGVVVYIYKEHNKPTYHLYAVHELLGFVVLVLLCLHYVGAAVAYVLCPRRCANGWRERHAMGGTLALIGTVAAAVSGAANYQALLDWTEFPYTSHTLRYGFVFVGLNIFAVLLLVAAAMAMFLLWKNGPSKSNDQLLLNA